MKVKAVLFDLDNTLIDFMRMKQECVRAAVKAMRGNGLPLSQKRGEEIVWRLYARHGFEYQKVFQKLLRQTIKEVNPRILAAGIVAYRKAKRNLILPYPRVRKTLYALKKKGYKLGVLTDAPRLQAWTRLVEMKVQGFFDIVVSFDETRKHKPRLLPFKKAVSMLGFKPKQVLMVGDSVERDVAGAKRVGMRTALAVYGEFKKQDAKPKPEPDFVLKKFSDLLKIL